ncbi:hypothetical protein KR044_001348 [Drosophila immigrans]|nr:hypothetical protein KR044_001348 [Drosophila immigrans]
MDSCCPVSRISESMAVAMGLAITRVGAEGVCTAVLRSKTIAMSKEVVFKTDPQLRTITPTKSIALVQPNHLSNLLLADQDWSSSREVSAVLGADVFSELLLPGILPSQGGLPMAQNSSLGWILFGTCSN